MLSLQPARHLIDVLVEEHRLLQRALDLFARYGAWVESGEPYDPRLARDFLRFFREFGDARHHQKEEAQLFPWLVARGLPEDSGPLAVLRAEHELGRDLCLSLALSADELMSTPLDEGARARFHAMVMRFVQLMAAHIEKEETVLFPLAERFARRLREHCVHHGGIPEEELAWIEGLELQARAWPLAPLSLDGLGTPYGFEQLCEQTLG